ncbi:MAG: tautomerase family protein [Propionibacteriaceae bacterium]|jgi:phenylpyruvate tautomerase PptA (4-oxalocrotonate tautomerase family)|nr:tautomerase family protein [Propionibacteriaceae bacterium]
MPTYQVFVPAGALDDEGKQRAAQAITRAHCAATGAPPFYVQVIFAEIGDTDRYVGGGRFNRHLWVRGDVRTGRTEEQRRTWLLGLADALAEATGWDPDAVWIDLCGIDPASILKYGQVFPPPGAEPAWLDALPVDAKAVVEELQSLPGAVPA